MSERMLGWKQGPGKEKFADAMLLALKIELVA